MSYKKILRSLVLGLVMALVVGGAAYALTLSSGENVTYTGGVAGATEKIDFDSGGSMIYDDWMMHIVTDDHLYLDAPGTVYVENDMDVTGDLVVDGTITGTTVVDSTTAHIFTFADGKDADLQDMWLKLGSIDPAILFWDASAATLNFSDNLAVAGTLAVTGDTTLTGTLNANDNNPGIEITSTTTGITAGGETQGWSKIAWTGASEWMQIFLKNYDATPNKSAAVIELSNVSDIVTNGENSDQITMEIKNDIIDGTDFAGDNLTALRARVKFKGAATYTSGNAQAIFATMGTGTGALAGDHLRTGYFHIWLGADPGAGGHASILVLENDQTPAAKEAYLDSFMYFHGGGSQYLFEFYEATTTSWASTGDLSTEAGWLKVKVGGSTKYIQLYDTVP